MTALPSGPFATVAALQTLKHRTRFYQRITLNLEIGDRAFAHAVEVTRCGHRIKARRDNQWVCVSDSHNTRTPGCGTHFTLTFDNGAPVWEPVEVAR